MAAKDLPEGSDISNDNNILIILKLSLNVKDI
jgi:hypothetical protein